MRLSGRRPSSSRRRGLPRDFVLGLLLCLCATAYPLPAGAATSCKPISGVGLVLRAPGVFVGDMHGTAEAPAFVKSLMCHLSRSRRPVLLALEYPSDQQHFLQDFLHSRAANPARTLLASPFWSRPTQDGRTSRAMLQLLDWIRGRIASGARVRVVAFDRLPPGALSGTAGFNARDAAMAVFLRQELARLGPGEFPIIFTGNVHARKTSGLPFVDAPSGAANAEPLGYRLRDLGYLHMNIASDGGSAWVCFGTCGVHSFGKAKPVSAFTVRRSSDAAYDLEYFVGSLTASPPAISGVATGQ